MELELLKKIWKESGSKEITARTGEQIAAMLSASSKNAVARMKRNLLIEFVAVFVLFGVAAAYYFYGFERRLTAISWAYIFMILLFAAYYYAKNRLLNNIQCNTCHVKSNLELQVQKLETYVHHYLVWGTLVLPALIIFAGLLVYHKYTFTVPKPVLFHSPAHPGWLTILAWLVLAVLVTIPVFFLNKYYIYRLYGRHIKNLKGLLEEINEA